MYKTCTLIIIVLISLGLPSCKQEIAQVDHLAHISDPDVKRVLASTCEASGGLENYMSIDSIIYDKRSVLYNADDSVESDVRQHHAYKIHPELSGVITWTDTLGDHSIVYNSSDPYKTLNGERLPNSTKSARESFMSSYYVLFLPFKLIDPGVDLTYGGTTIIDDITTEVIEARYAPTVHKNHSTSDEWSFYINKADGSVVSNLVYHPPTYAYIENTKYTDEYPLRMNTYRQTWRTDANRNKEYLRAEFWYSNYKFTK